MAVASPPRPTKPPRPPRKENRWMDRISRSGYFFGAVLLHLIVFVMISTWIIFPGFKPPAEDFTKTYLPSAPPPPPPPTQETMQVPTTTVAPPTRTIISPTTAPAFTVPLPDLTPNTRPTGTAPKQPDKVVDKKNSISPERLAQIMKTEQDNWGRDHQNILSSGGDPKNVVARFPVYLASYADGDWGYGQTIQGGKIISGSLGNLVAKINEWSKGNITGQVVPEPLNIGAGDLIDKKPPFIYFTGHKDFKLTDQEIQNLRDYLEVGGAIWGDNSLPGSGSRFDVAFHREMKRVIPDIDKNFEPIDITSDVFTKSWFPLTAIPQGMNYYAEPFEHLDIDGKLAIIYTPNDYNDMLSMRILPGDTNYKRGYDRRKDPDPLTTSEVLLRNKDVFFRNFELPACLECDKAGMNIISYMLVRFDKDLLLTP